MGRGTTALMVRAYSEAALVAATSTVTTAAPELRVSWTEGQGDASAMEAPKIAAASESVSETRLQPLFPSVLPLSGRLPRSVHGGKIRNGGGNGSGGFHCGWGDNPPFVVPGPRFWMREASAPFCRSVSCRHTLKRYTTINR